MKQLIMISLLSMNLLQARSIQVRAFKEIGNVAVAYTQTCKENKTSEACVALRAQLHLSIVDQLNILEQERNIKNVPIALKALKINDRAIRLSALIVLGPWAKRSRVGSSSLQFYQLWPSCFRILRCTNFIK